MSKNLVQFDGDGRGGRTLQISWSAVGIALSVLMLVAALGMWLGTIWTEDGRWGTSAGVFGLAGVVTLISTVIWMAFNPEDGD